MRFERADWVSNSDYPYMFGLRSPDDVIEWNGRFYREAVAWCRIQFGRASSDRERPRWNHHSGLICFGDETRAMAFKLRWC